MSFLTQRLANRYPLWTKLRRDPSSMGQRFMSAFAEIVEEEQVFNKRLSDELLLFKRQLGPGHLYRVNLDEADYFPLADSGGGAVRTVYPTVTGTLSATPYVLTRYEALADMLSAAPDRIGLHTTQAYTQYLVWSSSAVETYVDPPRPERLVLIVSGSTEYYRKTRVSNLDKSGRHQIVLRGTDEDDNEFSESVQILDDGAYRSRSFFKTLEEVTYEGFDGDIVIQWLGSSLPYELDPYRALVLDDNEGQLKLRLDTRVVGGPTYSYVVYETERLKLGELYRKVGVQIYENTEEHGEAILLDSTGNPFTAVDLAINPSNGKLYVLDDAGLVHVYDHAPTPFSAPVIDTETVDSYIELHPLQHYASFGVTEKVFTHFSRIRYKVARARIKRRTPAGVEEYLQADRTSWAVGSYWHLGVDKEFPSQTWVDFNFGVEYDELGQWEYSCEVETTNDSTTFVTAVMVDSMVAESSVDTSVVGPTDIDFSKEGWLAVANATTVSYFKEYIDGWLADTNRQQIIMHANYDSVDVTY